MLQKQSQVIGILLACLTANELFGEEIGPDTATIGIFTESVDPNISISGVDKFKWPVEEGAVVKGVVPEGPAHKAGFRKFDVMIRLAGKEIKGQKDIDKVLSTHNPKKRINAVVFSPKYLDNDTRVKWKRKSYAIAPTTLEKLFAESLVVREVDSSDSYFIEAKGTTSRVNDRSGLVARVYMYEGREPALTLTIKYVAKEWLFVESLMVKTSKGKVIIDGLDMERDFKSTIWEWCTINASGNADCMSAIGVLQSTSNAELIYQGSKYRKTIDLHNDDLVRLRLVVKYYDYLKRKKA